MYKFYPSLLEADSALHMVGEGGCSRGRTGEKESATSGIMAQIPPSLEISQTYNKPMSLAGLGVESPVNSDHYIFVAGVNDQVIPFRGWSQGEVGPANNDPCLIGWVEIHSFSWTT